MILYSSVITPRLQYITDFIGRELFGKPIHLTTDQNVFLNATGTRLNYSEKPLAAFEFHISPHSLLFENGIREHQVTCTNWKENKIFFQTVGDLPFDIFAACFYLLSRYEEWLPHQKDLYGRYAFENSLAWREKFLDKPLVGIWLQHFRESLVAKFGSLSFRSPAFSILPTYDIDEAWSYKHKSKARSWGATIRNLLKRDMKTIAERKAVLSGKVPDPFDAYDWMDTLHKDCAIQPMYFFLVAEKTGKFDKNILPEEQAMHQLIKRHANGYQLGIHPSWQSGDNPDLLQKEITTLEKLSGKNINSSRQHFIRFNIQGSFRQLLNAGIREDYSMGYGSINGFRASVATPFYWYDLEKEEQTDLMLYPFCFMDANSFFEQKQSPEKALAEMRNYYQEVKNVNGVFIMIWHNTFLGTASLFAGWRELYEKFIREIYH